MLAPASQTSNLVLLQPATALNSGVCLNRFMISFVRSPLFSLLKTPAFDVYICTLRPKLFLAWKSKAKIRPAAVCRCWSCCNCSSCCILRANGLINMGRWKDNQKPLDVPGAPLKKHNIHELSKDIFTLAKFFG